MSLAVQQQEHTRPEQFVLFHPTGDEALARHGARVVQPTSDLKFVFKQEMSGTILKNALILTQLVHDGHAYQLAVASFTQSVDVCSQEVHPEVQKLLDSPVFMNHMVYKLVDELKDGLPIASPPGPPQGPLPGVVVG